MSGIEWERMKMSGYFRHFLFREESTKRHPKENPINLEEDLEEDLLN